MVIVNPYAKSKVSNHNGKGTPSAASGEHTSNVTRGADVATLRRIGAFSNGASSNGNFSSDTTNENNPNLRNATMGCQSQFRMGSIKACKKAACGQRRRNNPRFVQTTVTGYRAFGSKRDCKLCALKFKVAMGEKRKEDIPHIGHHWLCPYNRKTGGVSISFVSSRKHLQENIRLNNMSIVDQPGTRKDGIDIWKMMENLGKHTTKH